ncbi:MAG: hypothetical protein LBE13_13445 [Bacteroidales bacterium]|nr:hypothetical protein [Bacteroidales bacterium]
MQQIKNNSYRKNNYLRCAKIDDEQADIKQDKAILPDDRMILFGLQARDDAWEDFNRNLLIMLDKLARTMDDYSNYAYFLFSVIFCCEENKLYFCSIEI